MLAKLFHQLFGRAALAERRFDEDAFEAAMRSRTEHREAAGWTFEAFRFASQRLKFDVPLPHLETLCLSTWNGDYWPNPLHLHYATRRGRTRVVGSACRDDRVVMEVWRGLADSRVEPQLADHVWGFRRGRSCSGAVAALCAGPFEPGMALVATDIQNMFPSLVHEKVHSSVAVMLGSDRLGQVSRMLVDRWLQAWTSGQGVPMGVSVAPLLANMYMATEVDRWLDGEVRAGRVRRAIRYADDMVVVTHEPDAYLAGLALTAQRSGLELNPAKTRIIRAGDSWPVRVLGYEVALGRGGLFHKKVLT